MAGSAFARVDGARHLLLGGPDAAYPAASTNGCTADAPA